MTSAESLWAAIEAGQLECVRELVDADPVLARGRSPDGLPLSLAARYRGRGAIAELLADRAGPLDVFTASALGRTEALERALDGAQVDARSPDGWTPLHLAAYFGQREAAALLIARGADLQARSENDLGNTPLHAAAAGGRLALVELLVESGLDVNAEAGGFTPLDIADEHGHDAIIRVLIDHGAHKASWKGDR